jgi:methionyl-tRNA synthetase
LLPARCTRRWRRSCEEWFEAGLKDWDISRDAPYFGFRIPGFDDKYFYVWLDAPVGYLASFRRLCDSPAGRARGLDFDSYLAPGSSAEMHHFIGKDIVYFHTLFWPAVLEAAGLRRPTAVHVHGFLTVNGQKMSKSRGTFVAAATWLEHLDPQCLRYYYAFKLGAGVDDIDLNLDDFVARVNADLVGKFVNLASRCAGFIRKLGDGKLAAELPDPALYERFVAEHDAICADYENRNYHSAVRRIMALADEANRYIAEHQPWVLAKEPGNEDQVVAICTQGLNLFKLLMTWLSPVIPFTADKAGQFLNTHLDDFSTVDQPLLDHKINKFKPLIQRVEEEQTDKLIAASRESLAAAEAGNSTEIKEQKDDANMIQFDDFIKVELRVARIEKAEEVEGADKLLRLHLDLGAMGKRQVLAGIRKHYQPEDLGGRLTVVVANLEPRKMRFGVSEGMVLAATGEDGRPHLLSPDSGAEPGMRIS